MINEELIRELQKHDPKAEMKVHVDAMLDDDIDLLVAGVKDVRFSAGQVIISADGVPAEERQAYDKKWGHE